MEARRGPQRDGHRTTLKVPEHLRSAASDFAAELGTSVNDAIVRLAEEGARARQRRLDAERISAERRAAVAQAGVDGDIDFPSDDVIRAAMLRGRSTD